MASRVRLKMKDKTMSNSLKYTGYGAHNDFLNELEVLKDSARLLANDLSRDEVSRAASAATSEAYFYCLHRLMTFYRAPAAQVD